VQDVAGQRPAGEPYLEGRHEEVVPRGDGGWRGDVVLL
jgi:hypothetical protein